MSYATVLQSIVDRFYVSKSKSASNLNKYECLNDLMYYRYVYEYEYEKQQTSSESGETKEEDVCVGKHKVKPTDKTEYKGEEITYEQYYKKMYPDSEFGTENGYFVIYESDYSYLYSSNTLYSKGYGSASSDESYQKESELYSTSYFPNSKLTYSTTASAYSKKISNSNGLLSLYQQAYPNSCFTTDSNNNIIISHPNLKKLFNKTIPDELTGTDSARSAIYYAMKQLYTDLDSEYPVEGMNYQLINSYSEMSKSYQRYDESTDSFIDYIDVWYARGNFYDIVTPVTEGNFINKLLIIKNPELYNGCNDYIDYIANYYLAPYEEEYKDFKISYNSSNNYKTFIYLVGLIRDIDFNAYVEAQNFIEVTTYEEEDESSSEESGSGTKTVTVYSTKLSAEMIAWVTSIMKKYPQLKEAMENYKSSSQAAKDFVYETETKRKQSSSSTYADDEEEAAANRANMFWRQKDGNVTYAQKVKDYITETVLKDLFKIKNRFKNLKKYIIIDSQLPTYYNTIMNLVHGFSDNDTKTSTSDDTCFYDTIHDTYTSGAMATWCADHSNAYRIYQTAKKKTEQFKIDHADTLSESDKTTLIYKFNNYYTLLEKLVPNTVNGGNQSYYDAGTSIYQYLLWLRKTYDF